MLIRLLILLALFILTGCQPQPPAYVTPPPIVQYDRPKPLPPPPPDNVRIGPGPSNQASRYTRTRTRVESHQHSNNTRPEKRQLPPSIARTPAHEAIPRGWIPAVNPNPWRWIVIHHSDTAVGSALAFDRYHRNVRHWDELGYHFVIGNGTGSGNGQIEVGPRWTKQKWGAHAGVAIYNEYGIGICVVGDFNSTHPSAAQMRSLAQLTGYLMHAYHIPADHVIGHYDCKRTDCPGRYMSLASVRHMATAYAQSEFAPPALARR